MRASSPASTPTCTPHRCAADRRTCLWRTSSPSPGSGVPASILGDRQNAVPHPIGGRRRGQTPIAPLGTTGSPPVAVCRPTDPRPRWPILAYGEKSGLEAGLRGKERVQLTLGRLGSAEPGLGEPRRPPLVADDRRARRKEMDLGAAAIHPRSPPGQNLGARDDTVES